jgi:hypothetical protein
MHSHDDLDSALRPVRRGFEVILGIVLLVALLVPLTAMVAVSSDLLNSTDGRRWAMWLVLVALGALAYFCITTGWRLLSGRPRSDGGLLHPWFMYALGVYATWYGSGRGLAFGPEFAQPYHAAAAEYFEIARERRRSRRPNKPSGGGEPGPNSERP